ncbi:hemoglobin-like flavoprotein [Pacificibacter maritimus]|uniref:Hemoglobin-like flavoprotein n=1 Tax=Pacificibacter maritimus TaxID=762213 RepID=A0A3N4U9Q3_9RHOB|nr:globin domain-containing protein [Pacificibacter maritimus]RPE67192.1 hemoglobin-like flavoprotein [Pacificibacter maritimus]
MFTQIQTDLIRSSFAAVMATRPEMATDFYTRLFITAPQLRDMFPQDVTTQATKLEATLQVALSTLGAPETLIAPLHALGARHAKIGVQDCYYITVSEVLLDTLAAEAGDLWTAETSQAWGALLEFISKTMIEGAKHARAA